MYSYLGCFCFFSYYVLNILLHVSWCTVDRFLWGTFLGVQLMTHKVLSNAKLSQSSCSNYTLSCSVFVFPLFHTPMLFSDILILPIWWMYNGVLLGLHSHFPMTNEAKYLFILFIGHWDFPFGAYSKFLDRAIGLCISFMLIFRNSFM